MPSLDDQLRSILYRHAADRLRQLASEAQQRAAALAGWPIEAIGQAPAIAAIWAQVVLAAMRLEVIAVELQAFAGTCDDLADQLEWVPR